MSSYDDSCNARDVITNYYPKAGSSFSSQRHVTVKDKETHYNYSRSKNGNVYEETDISWSDNSLTMKHMEWDPLGNVTIYTNHQITSFDKPIQSFSEAGYRLNGTFYKAGTSWDKWLNADGSKRETQKGLAAEYLHDMTFPYITINKEDHVASLKHLDEKQQRLCEMLDRNKANSLLDFAAEILGRPLVEDIKVMPHVKNPQQTDTLPKYAYQ